jgi:GxxExxY protein
MAALPITRIKGIAMKIMAELGAGYSESCYQTALYNQFIKIDPNTIKEKTVPVVYEGEIIGTCRADLVTSDTIVEVKATTSMPPRVTKQILKYLINFEAHDKVLRHGVVINFNQDTEQAEFIVVDAISRLTTSELKRTKRSLSCEASITLTNEQMAKIARNRDEAILRRQSMPVADELIGDKDQ